jgi:hypothetical protein
MLLAVQRWVCLGFSKGWAKAENVAKSNESVAKRGGVAPMWDGGGMMVRNAR